MALKVMPMLALVVISLPATMKRLAQRLQQPLGQDRADSARCRGPRPGSRTRRRPAGPRMSCGRSCCWMRRATATRNSSPHRMAQAVVDQLEAVEVEEHQAEVLARSACTRSSACARCSWKRRRLGRPVRLSWKAMCCSPASARAPRGDVLHLQDQAGCVGVGSEKRLPCTAAQTSAAVAVAQPQLDGEGRRLSLRVAAGCSWSFSAGARRRRRRSR